MTEFGVNPYLKEAVDPSDVREVVTKKGCSVGWSTQLQNFYKKLLESQVEPDHEIDKIISENAWELYE